MAVALSIVDVARRSAIPHDAVPHDAVLGSDERMGRYADVSVHRRARITPGVLVYRLDDRLLFANAGYVTGRIHEAVNGNPTPVRWLVFDGEALAHLDATGAGALGELIRSFQAEGVTSAAATSTPPSRPPPWCQVHPLRVMAGHPRRRDPGRYGCGTVRLQGQGLGQR